MQFISELVRDALQLRVLREGLHPHTNDEVRIGKAITQGLTAVIDVDAPEPANAPPGPLMGPGGGMVKNPVSLVLWVWRAGEGAGLRVCAPAV